MCYDISFTVNIPQLSDFFPDLVFDDQLNFDFEGTHIMGHGYGLHPIIYRNRDDQQLHCTAMEWGCIPYYVKKKFPSIEEAAYDAPCDHSYLTHVLKGRKTHVNGKFYRYRTGVSNRWTITETLRPLSKKSLLI